MNQSLQLGFISVLLALIMYFVFLSVQKHEAGLPIDTSDNCPAICCLTRCETHKIEIVDAQHVRFNTGLLSPDEFAQHLLAAHRECPIGFVHIQASPDLAHEIVLSVSNRILELAPSAQISWDDID